MFHICNSIGFGQERLVSHAIPDIHMASAQVAVQELIEFLEKTPKSVINIEDPLVLRVWPSGEKGMLSFAEDDERLHISAAHHFVLELLRGLNIPVADDIRFEIECHQINPDLVSRALARTFGTEEVPISSSRVA